MQGVIASAPHPCLSQKLCFPWDRALYKVAVYGLGSATCSGMGRFQSVADVQIDSMPLAKYAGDRIAAIKEKVKRCDVFAMDGLSDSITQKCRSVLSQLSSSDPDYRNARRVMVAAVEDLKSARESLKEMEADAWLPEPNEWAVAVWTPKPRNTRRRNG